MTNDEVVTIPRHDYEALLLRIRRLEDLLHDHPRLHVPDDVALDIRRGVPPIQAYRKHHRLTLRQLSDRSGLALGYLSEIERRRRPGTIDAISRIATALGATIDILIHGLPPDPVEGSPLSSP